MAQVWMVTMKLWAKLAEIVGRDGHRKSVVPRLMAWKFSGFKSLFGYLSLDSIPRGIGFRLSQIRPRCQF
jgi:hypothetical protein